MAKQKDDGSYDGSQIQVLEGLDPVSYTHLDVYKRQVSPSIPPAMAQPPYSPPASTPTPLPSIQGISSAPVNPPQVAPPETPLAKDISAPVARHDDPTHLNLSDTSGDEISIKLR